MLLKPQISVIIPALNEARTITSVLRSLARQDMISVAQVIVVDGMSEDETVDVAYGFPFVEVVQAQPGRANQMNHGARVARAPILWFLHADSTIPEPTSINEILDVMADPEVAAGAFRFKLRGDDLYYRLVTGWVNLRSSLLGRPYGDQGLFVRTKVFQELGGYAPVEMCEDLDFVLRVRKMGRFVLLRHPVETSARTWQRYGKLRTTIYHLREWLAFELSRLLRPRSPLVRDRQPESGVAAAEPMSAATPGQGDPRSATRANEEKAPESAAAH